MVLTRRQDLCQVLLALVGCMVVLLVRLSIGRSFQQSTLNGLSCSGRCLEVEPIRGEGTCRCDPLCFTYDECCPDFQHYCIDTAHSWHCDGRCGEYRSNRSLCSCASDCPVFKDCCSDYNVKCRGETSWVLEPCEDIVEPECPPGFSQRPLIMLSLDGFGSHFLEERRSLIPVITKMRSCGTHAQYMRPVYPSKTFPNHYSMVTGLYPESHGIIGNTIYDESFNATFSIIGKEKLEHRWWGGQPIWITVEKQGKKASTFFWPFIIPHELRVFKVLQWLDLPASERPIVYGLYIDEPDKKEHVYGPYHDEIDRALAAIDTVVGQLMDGLKQRLLHKCVDIMIISDHGMAAVARERVELLDPLLMDVENLHLYPGTSGRIRPQPPDSSFNPQSIITNLTCHSQHFKPYLKHHLPKRLHYAFNQRIEDIHLLVEEGWMVYTKKEEIPLLFPGGDHGYDNSLKRMQAVFIGYGPSFKSKTQVQPFENIELYNLMCDLLNVTPMPNNGTHGSLNSVLRRPTFHPAVPWEISAPSACRAPPAPLPWSTCDCPTTMVRARALRLLWVAQRRAVRHRLVASRRSLVFASIAVVCVGSPSNSNISRLAPIELLSRRLVNSVPQDTAHLPYGRPLALLPANYCLLHQSAFESAYSQDYRMPLWTAYTLPRDVVVKPLDLHLSRCLHMDLKAAGSSKWPCKVFHNGGQLTYSHLHPQGLWRSDENIHESLLTSNVVPMHRDFKRIWTYLHEVWLKKYASQHNGVNVISGPAFDYDFNGRFDSIKLIKQHVDGAIPVSMPTHFFFVLTTCCNEGTALQHCPRDWQPLAFIIPNHAHNADICQQGEAGEKYSFEQLLRLHRARVRDVELITGLNFYSDTSLPINEVLALKTLLNTF
uniref:autotaxin isoform X2 n=1 Tax=Myxine glutinosa TaxID=7769 RepID=UPI00358E72E8